MFDFKNVHNNILLLIITPTLISGICLSSYFVLDKTHNAELNLRQQGSSLITAIEIMLSDKDIGNSDAIEKQLTKLHSTVSSLLAIAIIDQNNHMVFNSSDERFFKDLKLTQIPTTLVSKTRNRQLHIATPIKLTNLKNKTTSTPYYLSLLFDKNPLQLILYQSLLISSLLIVFLLSISLLTAYYISKKIKDLTSSLTLVKENMQSDIAQATAELTQTLETIEVQNIEIDFARKEAVKVNQVKSEFLANISHEIRTPMNGVIGFTNLLLKSKVDEIQHDYLITIRKSANQLLSIIEDILDFSKIEAGKMTLDSVVFSFHDCVEEVITLLSTESMKKNLELIPLIYKNVPDFMLGDPTRVNQVLTNLISNAIKFTEKGSIVVRVLVEESSEDGFLIRATITDTGMGMTDEQIGKLFQPFSQVNQQNNRHHSGTGLGLVISKKLIEGMGGTISIESKSNEGTSFSFTFRAQKPSKQFLNTTNDLNKKITLLNQKVYLFDHHPMALLAMKQVLLSWSIDVSCFQNIDKLIRTIELTTTNPIGQDKVDKAIIVIGLTNEYDNIVNKINDNIKILSQETHIQGILLLGHLENRFKNESLMENTIFHYLEKPLTRQKLKSSFEKMGLLENNQSQTLDMDIKPQTFASLRILVVDDNSDNLKLITIVLEEMLIEVTQAYDGLSAIELCRDEHFDLIFMDIRMPGIDGVESSKRIHRHHLNSSTPIIALTAHAMAGEKEQLLKSGLQDFIIKPISSRQLTKLISQWTKPSIKYDTSLTDESIAAEPPARSVNSIDWHKALEITAGREDIAKELLEAVSLNIPDFKQQLRKASEKSTSELLSNAHKFHGLVCYTGAPQLQLLTRTLEKNINNDYSFVELKETIALLLTELENVELAAVNYLTEKDYSLTEVTD